jgi:hypothetical protein
MTTPFRNNNVTHPVLADKPQVYLPNTMHIKLRLRELFVQAMDRERRVGLCKTKISQNKWDQGERREYVS